MQSLELRKEIIFRMRLLTGFSIFSMRRMTFFQFVIPVFGTVQNKNLCECTGKKRIGLTGFLSCPMHLTVSSFKTGKQYGGFPEPLGKTL